MKRLSIVLGSIGLLAGCGQILGLGDYEVEETTGSGGTGATGGAGGTQGGSGGAGGSNGGSAGAGDGGTAGTGTTASGGTAGSGDGGSGGTAGSTTTTTTMGTGGSAGEGNCECEQRDPCMLSECEDGQCVDSPAPSGTECISGNFSGVCDDEQQCVPCVDDADDTETDSGCPETAPECDDTGATPECTGCTDDIDCDDDVDCTTDTCDDGRCMRAVLPAGVECSDGVCNGAGTPDSCVPCVDNHATGADAGCEAALPLCDASQVPAACVECLADLDCDDDNDCTTETCDSNVCAFETVPAGEACLGGVCSGVAGSESCGACLDTAAEEEVDQGCTADAPVCDMGQVPPVCTGCTDNTDCDDGFECTTDTCNGSQVCVNTPDDAQCEVSGDVCMPNQCVPGMGCVPVDVTETPQLLANGALDSAGDAWLEASSNGYPLIVVEDASVAAHTPTRYAWLGGAPYELSELTQVVSVPEGTQSLTLTFYYYLSGFVYPYYDYNVMGAQLRATDGVTVLHEFQRLGNQDFNSDWVEFTGTVDATAWAGTDVQVYFWASIGADYYWYYGYPYYTDYNVGNSNYRIDSTSLTATVCQ